MASSSSTTEKYDVFLNFRGSDTRDGFTTRLYKTLCLVGINTFIDKKLGRGQEISPALLQSIESSSISVVIFSENYAFSSYCLDELAKIIECRESMGQVVIPVFYKVNPSDVGELRESYEKAFVEHEAKFKEDKDKLEKWKSALRQARVITGWHIRDDRDDAQCVTEIVESISQKLSEEKIGPLASKLQELLTIEKDIKSRFEHSQMERHKVEVWLKSVGRIKDEVQSVQSKVEKKDWTIELGGSIKKLIIKVTECIDQKGGIEEALLASHQTNGKPLPTKSLEGRSFQNNIDLIMERLSCNEVSSIGICGMGGVGKTTLMTHVHNKLLENPSKFSNVYWVKVSQDVSVQKLQSLIAKTIKINLEAEEDERKWVAILSKELNKRQKFVLILDDVWNHFDAGEVGIPIGSNGSKLIVTSRSVEVCTKTNCKMVIKVEPLNTEEAWELFANTFGCELSPRVEVIAKHIVRKCGGLPLAIVTMAKSMKGVNDVQEWENALTEMERSIPRQQDTREEVFRVLRHSYTRLNDPALQQCFLYCALLPEDFVFSRELLIHYLIVEGIIDEEMSTRKQKFDKGHTMIKKLVRVSLLEQVGERVKMHSLTRDMAIQIMKECLPSIVEPNKQLRYIPEEKYWRKDIVRVSLMMNDICEIPSDFSPSCPNLTTLLLLGNWKLNFFPDSFFDQLKGLKVLDISLTNIYKLPESFYSIRSLTALLARGSFLSYVPTLQNLKPMDSLDLYDCRYITQVPLGVAFLTNLTYLNLMRTGITIFPTGILPWLSHLQFLAYDKESRNAGEIGRLQKLETLYWWFPTMTDLIILRRLLPIDEISYSFRVGPKLNYLDTIYEAAGHRLTIERCSMTRELLELNFQIDNLSLVRVSFPGASGLCLQNPIGLLSLLIDGCDGIQYLISKWTSPLILLSLETLYVYNMHDLVVLFNDSENVFTQRLFPAFSFGLKELHISNCSVSVLLPGCLVANLPYLEIIQVSNCEALEEIISARENYAIFPLSLFPLSLPNLKSLNLFNLPRLKSICRERIECDYLKFLRICNCQNLRNIPISLPLPYLESVKVWPLYWWDTMMWDWVDKKYALPFTAINHWSLDSEVLEYWNA